jgi:hypothetical protein
MTEQTYFEQCTGDPRTALAYFIFSEGSADYGSLEEDDCLEAYAILSARHPSIQFEIRRQEVTQDIYGDWVRND